MRPAHGRHRSAFEVLKGMFMQVRSVRKVFIIGVSDAAIRRRRNA
jgi:hypothetical protein